MASVDENGIYIAPSVIRGENGMEYRSVGLSGLKASPLCIGTMNFRDAAGEREAEKIVELAREIGLNFIDTADSYGRGDSERIVGRIIAQDRENWVLVTKVGSLGGDEPFERGLSRRWMLRAIDRSLKRLGTDYVDIWYLHMPDDTTPLEESISAMGDVIADGKVTYWGFSNYRGWQVGEIINLSDALGVPRPIICQPHYNALNRTPETDLLPACDHYGIAVAPYSPRCPRGSYWQVRGWKKAAQRHASSRRRSAHV
jgi:aryl-alcohol dehydrogenase-like predicted oxidoreductase